MTDERAKQLANDEKIIAVLSPQKNAVKSDILRECIGILFALLIVAMMLVLFFRGENTYDGNSFIVMGVMAGIMFLFGAGIAFLELLQLKFSGMVLTPTKIVGYAGFPILKKFEVLHGDNKGFQVFPAKKEAYFVHIGSITAAYMENPEEFEASFYDLIENNFKSSTVIRPAKKDIVQ